MRKVSTSLIASLVVFSGYSQIPGFTYNEIGKTDENLLCQESLVDLDNDSDLDIIVGSGNGTLWWFENIDGKEFKRYLLGENSLSDKGGAAVDIDGDGLVDQVSGGTWYKNPGNKESPWERFENGVIFSYDLVAADLNGDSLPEIIALSAQEGTYVYFPGSDPTKKWKKKRIGDGVHGGIAPMGIGDLDRDGDVDIVRSNVWFENVNGNALKWLEHKSFRFLVPHGKFAKSSRTFTVDMDGDGDLDVIQTQANEPNGGIVWHECKDQRARTWFVHKIDKETLQDLHSLCVADFDNDGDIDIFSGGGPMSKDLRKRCFIWENKDGKGDDWERHEIINNTECIDAMCGDIDDDGDIDIICKPWKGETVYLLRNNLR